MVSPIKPFPIRMAPDLRAKVVALAQDLGRSQHSVMIEAMAHGLAHIGIDPAAPGSDRTAIATFERGDDGAVKCIDVRPDPKEVLRQAEAKAAHLGTKKSRWAFGN